MTYYTQGNSRQKADTKLHYGAIFKGYIRCDAKTLARLTNSIDKRKGPAAG